MVAWLLMVVAGCAPDSDFTLAIDPLTPPNVELGLADPDVTLVHRVDGQSTLYPLGPLEGDGFDDLPPLADGTVGLLLTKSGTAGETYVPADLLGYGEAPLGGALAKGREQRTVSMLVTEFAGSGDLGLVPRRRAPLLGAAALLPDGSAWMFGGQRDGTSHDTIQRVPDIRGGSWDTEEVGTLPSGDTVLLTATPLDDGTILVAGGRPEYFAISNNLRHAYVYDPASGELVWEAQNGMNPARSRHRAMKLRTGRVLVFGGWQGAGVDALAGTFQIFDPVDQRFENAGTAAAGPLGANLADVGGDGVVVCGGYTFDFDLQKLLSTSACDRISLSGDVIPFPDLPEPVSMAATAALPDGRILVAGGVIGDIDIPFEDGFLVGSNVGDATDRAFLYEPSNEAWREVGSLSEARAGAAALPSGDGRFIVFGGAQLVGAMISEDDGAVFCPEVYDPDADGFVSGGSCSSPASGAFPLVSAQPGIGAFVVEGHLGTGGEEAGGRSYGVIGLAPTL